jgi:hypothetical protein
MKNVFFYPHVGKNYETKGFNGLKLLILGESHYCGDECEVCGKLPDNECSKFTEEVLNRYFDYKKGNVPHENWMTTFTRFTNVLLEEQADNVTVLDFWDSVIFYNYVQSSTKGPRIPPTSRQFDESKDAFIEVLENYKPHLILVWGNRLWENLPDTGLWGKENILNNENDHFYYYEVGNKRIPAYRVCHPSTHHFNYESSKCLKEAMRLSKLLQVN